MTRDEAIALVKKHANNVLAAARAAGIPKTTFYELYNGARNEARQRKVSGPPCQKTKTLADFRAQYDKSFIVPARVRDALKVLGASGWEYEIEFAKAAGVSLADLGRFRDQFADFVVVIGRDSRRAWAGSRATATAMREMLA